MPKSRVTFFVLCFSFFASHQICGQGLVINEIMSDNETSILDEDGESSDWIELYNASSESINLKGYQMSDDVENPDKWTFPSIEIGANQFLLLFASEKDKSDGSFLHTNFRISSDGEEVILSNSSGIIIDQYEKIDLEEDQSFGRVPDGSDNKLILYNSSPGESNNASNSLSFSHEAGFYKNDITLLINSLTEDSIYCTFDGAEPNPAPELHTNEVILKNKTQTPNVWSEIPTTPTEEWITNPVWSSPDFLITKANIIRCASFRNGTKTSKTYSKTYLIEDDVFEKYDMPIISLITEGSNFFDHENGIYVPGIDYDPEVPEWTGNYFRKDIGSERPIHIEYFDLQGNLGFSQDAGARIHGGKTRHGAQKSLKLYARGDYGTKYFNYQLMPQKEVNQYKRFILQTTTGAWGGDSVIKDILSHEIVRDLDFEKMDYQPTIVFLNGEYWGIHHIRDRFDEYYVSYTSGLDADSIEMNTGGSDHYNNLIDYIKEHMPIDNDEYAHISEQIEIDAYIDYQIAEMYLNNYDWPANNIKYWRPNKPGGKWRWMFFDIDGGFRDYNYNMLIHNTSDDPEIKWPNNSRSTLLFRALIGNEIFQDKFITRYKDLIENEFKTSVTVEKLNTIVDQYTHEMPNHIVRWHFPPSMDTWKNDINEELIEFLKKRPCTVVEHIKDFFDLEEYNVECLDTIEIEEPPPTEYIENIIISPNPSFGLFTIYNKSDKDKEFEITLVNTLGQVIYQKQSFLLQSYTYKEFNYTYLISGIYYLRIKENEEMKTYPIMITN